MAPPGYKVLTEEEKDEKESQDLCYAIVTGYEDGTGQYLWRSFKSATAAETWLKRTIYEWQQKHLVETKRYSFFAAFLDPPCSFITCLPVREAQRQIYVAP
jgi:hypothetical protein